MKFYKRMLLTAVTIAALAFTACGGDSNDAGNGEGEIYVPAESPAPSPSPIPESSSNPSPAPPQTQAPAAESALITTVLPIPD